MLSHSVKSEGGDFCEVSYEIRDRHRLTTKSLLIVGLGWGVISASKDYSALVVLVTVFKIYAR